jgi:HemY protein
MMRAVLVVVTLGVVAYAAAWLADYPGMVAIDWGEWRIEASLVVAIGAVVLFAVLVALAYRAWRWMRNAPRRLRERHEADRRRQGYRALTRGMVAVAAGDAEESRRLAKRAESLLEEPPLTLLLSAQAAQLNGDDHAAEKYFQLMLANPELEFLGLRGLLTSELRQGNTVAALEHARHAYRLSPRSEWIQATLFELQLEANQWKQAEALLHDVGRRGGAPEATLRRRRSILLLEQAADVEASGDRAAAAALAEKAHTSAPEFVPAAVAAARLLTTVGKAKRAQRALEDTWRLAPHPDVAAALLAVWPKESPKQRLARTQALATLNPGHVEGDIAIARAAIAAADYPRARRSLDVVTGARAQDLESRVCRLRADLEDAEHGPGLAARDWLMRASSARPDPAWVCGRCGQGTPDWRPSCPFCNAFDSLSWKRIELPVADDGSAATAGARAVALARAPAPVARLAAPSAATSPAAPTTPSGGNGGGAAVLHSPPPSFLAPMPPDVPALGPREGSSRGR